VTPQHVPYVSRSAIATELTRLADAQVQTATVEPAPLEPVAVLPARTPSEIAMLTIEKPVSYAPYVYANSVTQFTGYAKRGKTSFLLYLIGCIVHGVECLDRPTIQTGVVYLTEEHWTPLRAALTRAGLLRVPNIHFVSRREVQATSWTAVMSAAVNTCIATKSSVLVVDTFPSWAGLRGDSENNAGDVLAALEPVQRAAMDGRAVVLVQHDRKGGGVVGESGRGSSAFAGAVDTILSLRRPEGNTNPNRRVLEAVSRFDGVPEAVTIERAVDVVESSHTPGSRFEKKLYVALGEPGAIALRLTERAVVEALEARGSLTVADLKKALPDHTLSTINRSLDGLIPDTVERSGSGKRGSPYTYTLKTRGSLSNLDPGGVP
jgi:hypothetical protein